MSIINYLRQEIAQKNANFKLSIPFLKPAIAVDWEGKKVCCIDGTIQDERRKFFLIATCVSVVACLALAYLAVIHIVLPLKLAIIAAKLPSHLLFCAKCVFVCVAPMIGISPWILLDQLDRKQTLQAIDQEAVDQYQKSSHPHKQILEWFAKNSSAVKLLFQQEQVNLTKSSPESQTLFTSFWKNDAVQSFDLLWEKLTKEERVQAFLDLDYDETLTEAPACLMHLLNNNKLNPLDFALEGKSFAEHNLIWHQILVIGAWKKSLLSLIDLNYPIDARNKLNETVIAALKKIQTFSIKKEEEMQELNDSIHLLNEVEERIKVNLNKN